MILLMKRKSMVTGLLLAAILSASCVNDEYDLDDIDCTIGINTDLQLPVVSSGSIKLTDFIGDNEHIGEADITGVSGKALYFKANGSTRFHIPVIAAGEIEYNLDTENIRIGELPDFLKSNNVKLDLKNPIIKANVNAPTLPDGCTILADMDITSVSGSCSISGLMAKRSPSEQYIASEEDNTMTGEWLKPASGSVNSLFNKKIPEEMTLSVTKLKAENVSGLHTKGYDVTVDFELYAPLCIGSEEFLMEYEAEETGWGDDYGEDVKKLDIELITLNADLVNGLPVDADVLITPIDRNGNRVNGLEVFHFSGKAGTTQPISYELKSSDNRFTLNNFINGDGGAQQLDGVKVTTTLKASSSSVGKYLTTESYAKFTNVKVRVKGQTVYDAN